jgi:hypothetical protein
VIKTRFERLTGVNIAEQPDPHISSTCRCREFGNVSLSLTAVNGCWTYRNRIPGEGLGRILDGHIIP